MPDVTRLIEAAAAGDPRAAADLLPLVYDELRRLAVARMAGEKAGQTLQATALVHEAYLRLVGDGNGRDWNGRAHFFGAAAEAMRRILVDRARRKQAVKHGGRARQLPLEAADVGHSSAAEELLNIDEALTRLAAEDARAARLIHLRYFAGLSVEDAAELVGIARSTAYEHWAYARVRLKTLLDRE
jgi:RNA polymerase sigma factor (TIGR02999 family)